jgi:hypothetical protein
MKNWKKKGPSFWVQAASSRQIISAPHPFIVANEGEYRISSLPLKHVSEIKFSTESSAQNLSAQNVGTTAPTVVGLLILRTHQLFVSAIPFPARVSLVAFSRRSLGNLAIDSQRHHEFPHNDACNSARITFTSLLRGTPYINPLA